MLSRRNKLLVQPWEDRRFKDHRSKVREALPSIDASAPPARPHVALKLKKWQRESERHARLQSDNFALLQRLSAIMRTNRLDNRWTTPMPHLQQKVGQYLDADSLQERLACVRLSPPSATLAASRTKCYACEFKKLKSGYVTSSTVDSLPSI